MDSEREPLLYNSKNKETEERVKKRNVLILGLGFFFVYTGYLTAAGTSETMLRSFSYRTGKTSNGFISLGINALFNGVTAPFVPILFRLMSRRTTMFLGALLTIILGIITTVGGLVFLLSKPEVSHLPTSSSSILSECKSNFLAAFKMAKKRPVQLLMPAMALLGLEIAFYQLAMPTCIGTTHELDDPKGSVGLVMIFLGAGELLGTFCQLAASKMPPMDSRIAQVTVGTALYIIASAISFCMFPEECTIHETFTEGIIKPRRWILLLCAVIFGFYDCTMQMCINQMFGTLFRSEEESGGFYVLLNLILCATLTAGFMEVLSNDL
ncbi:Oidioi.mRNA.OKI2018_I69.chr1.g1212.t1.cds [Oikopleura dioica]|uniref:UNC93-like protein MFSD11 n=1 Tax=Oikopleura dioica TaxID=34765 RepID=A0ABN7SR10_OIKDI|nr:Oidioi.mRNA.OKI2018_I69.chr1.g1212.t1.cds [Oikopleura dioica]